MCNGNSAKRELPLRSQLLVKRFHKYIQSINELSYKNANYSSAGVVNQSIPLVLPIKTEDKERLTGAEAFTLKYQGQDVAVLRQPEFYPHNKEERCSRQFGTANPGHPYVKVKRFYLFYSRFPDLLNCSLNRCLQTRKSQQIWDCISIFFLMAIGF